MVDLVHSPADASAPWGWAAASDRTTLLCGAILLAGGLVLILLTAALPRLSPCIAVKATRRDSESGTATLEFCLVFPIVLFFALLLAQTATLMAGNMVVHYAAFAATRTAIVRIPADYSFDGEPPNVLIHREGRRKYDSIRQAAVVALWPVAGRGGTSNVPADRVAEAVGDYFDAYNVNRPEWVHRLLPDRLRYAADPENTVVTVYHYDGGEIPGTPLLDGEIATFGPRDPVTVHVRHRLNLGVPYVRAIFADGRHATGGAYTIVNARSTLTNEGIVDELPSLPELERRP